MPSVLKPQDELVERTQFVKGDPVYRGKIFKSRYSKKNVCGASLLHRDECRAHDEQVIAQISRKYVPICISSLGNDRTSYIYTKRFISNKNHIFNKNLLLEF